MSSSSAPAGSGSSQAKTANPFLPGSNRSKRRVNSATAASAPARPRAGTTAPKAVINALKETKDYNGLTGKLSKFMKGEVEKPVQFPWPRAGVSGVSTSRASGWNRHPTNGGPA